MKNLKCIRWLNISLLYLIVALISIKCKAQNDFHLSSELFDLICEYDSICSNSGGAPRPYDDCDCYNKESVKECNKKGLRYIYFWSRVLSLSSINEALPTLRSISMHGACLNAKKYWKADSLVFFVMLKSKKTFRRVPKSIYHFKSLLWLDLSMKRRTRPFIDLPNGLKALNLFFEKDDFEELPLEPFMHASLLFFSYTSSNIKKLYTLPNLSNISCNLESLAAMIDLSDVKNLRALSYLHSLKILTISKVSSYSAEIAENLPTNIDILVEDISPEDLKRLQSDGVHISQGNWLTEDLFIP